jgi:MFS family permease
MDRTALAAAPLFLGLVLYAASNLGYWWASTVVALLAFRTLVGIAVALHSTASHTLAAHLVPAQRRGELLSVYAVAATAAQGVAPAIGVSIAGRAGDPALFLVAFSLNLLAFVLAWPLRDVRRPPAEHRRNAFINPSVLVPGLLMLTIMATFGANIALLPLHASRRGLENPGTVFVANSIGLLLAQAFAGRVSDRYGRLTVVGPGLLAAAAGMLLTSALSGAGLYLAVVLSGVGLGACQPALQALAADLVRPEDRGTAMGTLGLFHEFGVIVGAVGGGLIGRGWGLDTTYIVGGVVAVAGAVAAFTLHRARAFPPAAAGHNL